MQILIYVIFNNKNQWILGFNKAIDIVNSRTDLSSEYVVLTDGDIVDEASYGIDFLPDWDDSPLTDLFSRQTHIRMGYTWRNDNSEYNPGKLDYILYTDSVLEPVKHFVLNTLAMSEEDLSFYNLNSEDTKIASDHLPRVKDIAEDSEEPTWVWPDSEVPSASSTIRVLIVFPDEGDFQ